MDTTTIVDYHTLQRKQDETVHRHLYLFFVPSGSQFERNSTSLRTLAFTGLRIVGEGAAVYDQVKRRWNKIEGLVVGPRGLKPEAARLLGDPWSLHQKTVNSFYGHRKDCRSPHHGAVRRHPYLSLAPSCSPFSGKNLNIEDCRGSRPPPPSYEPDRCVSLMGLLTEIHSRGTQPQRHVG